MSKKKTLIYFNIAIFCISLFLCLAAGEIIARLFHLSKTFDSYPWQAGRSVKEVKYEPRKNSYGWRDREYDRDKEEGVMRIACMGDSVTEGYRVELEDTFPKLLESNFAEDNMGHVEVMNIGILGFATEENLATLDDVLDFNPDVIVYQFGLNDIKDFEYYKESVGVADANVQETGFSLKGLLRRSALYYAIAERYNYLKLQFGGKNWSFDKWSTSDQVWKREFEKFNQAFDRVEPPIKILFVNMPYDFQVYSDRPEVFIPSEKIEEFCQNNGYDFIDFTKIFKEEEGIYSIYLDDCHLSKNGHEIVSRKLKEYIVDNYLTDD